MKYEFCGSVFGKDSIKKGGVAPSIVGYFWQSAFSTTSQNCWFLLDDDKLLPPKKIAGGPQTNLCKKMVGHMVVISIVDIRNRGNPGSSLSLGKKMHLFWCRDSISSSEKNHAKIAYLSQAALGAMIDDSVFNVLRVLYTNPTHQPVLLQGNA